MTRLRLAEFRGNDLQYKVNSACGTSSDSRLVYAKNVGWRLDYHLASPAFANTAREAAIFKDIKFSDHAPLTIDYDVGL